MTTKSTAPLYFYAQGIDYELTKTHLRELGSDYNSVQLKHIAKAWRDNNPDGQPLPSSSRFFFFQRFKSGRMDIGCRSFSPTKAALILKAAGVRVSAVVAKRKTKKKSKAKSSKR